MPSARASSVGGMALRDFLLLSPWAKWRSHGKFPFKAAIHIVLIVLITTQCLLYAQERNEFLALQNSAFVKLLLPDDHLEPKDTGFGVYSYDYARLQHFVENMQDVVYNYENLNEVSPDYYNTQGRKAKMTVTTYLHDSVDRLDFRKKMDMSTVTREYDVTTDNMGLFNDTSPQKLNTVMNRLVSVDISFSVESANILPAIPQCIEWDVVVHYDFKKRAGIIHQYFDQTANVCSTQHADLIDLSVSPIFWLAILCILFSAWSMFLLTRQIVSIAQIRVSLVNMWTLVTLISSIMNIVASAFLLATISYKFTGEDVVGFLNGFAALLCWVNLVRYFEFTPKLYILVLTLRRGMPNLLRFVLGTAPIFLGYATMGTVLFGSYCHYFATLDNSAVTLFSVLNGDVIHDTFDMIYSKNVALGIISRVYLYTFVCLFIYAVLNIFIHIMEDGFFSAKENPGTTARAEKFIAALEKNAGSQGSVNGPGEVASVVNHHHHHHDRDSLNDTQDTLLQDQEPLPIDDMLKTLEDTQQYLRHALYGLGVSSEERFCLQMMHESAKRVLSVRIARGSRSRQTEFAALDELHGHLNT